MIKYKNNGIAQEQLDNCTICVLDSQGIRKMRHMEDINEQLVYVNNVDIEPFLHQPIKEGEYCRYVDVMVNVRQYIDFFN